MSDLLTEVRAGLRLPDPLTCRSIRRAAGVTQQRTADELDVHWTTVARWERGERQPRGELRARYSELLAQLALEVGPGRIGGPDAA